MIEKLKSWAQNLKRDCFALWIAARDPRVPWHAKMVAGCVAAYALSPIDLIPDFIPVVGYLDDLIIVPIGIYLTLKLIPRHVVADSREKADAWIAERRQKPKNYVTAFLFVLIWLAFAYWAWTFAAEWFATST